MCFLFRLDLSLYAGAGIFFFEILNFVTKHGLGFRFYPASEVCLDTCTASARTYFLPVCAHADRPSCTAPATLDSNGWFLRFPGAKLASIFASPESGSVLACNQTDWHCSPLGWLKADVGNQLGSCSHNSVLSWGWCFELDVQIGDHYMHLQPSLV